MPFVQWLVDLKLWVVDVTNEYWYQEGMVPFINLIVEG